MKTEVYSWRLSAHKKVQLESVARKEGKSVGQLLDEISSQWLQERHASLGSEDAEQEALRTRVLALTGTIRGGEPTRSQRTGELVRGVIWQKHLKEKQRNAPRRNH